MMMTKTMRMTSNSSSSWEEKKNKKNMGLLIHIIPPTSSITTTNEWSQDHQESDFLPARGQGGGGGGEGVMVKQMKAQHPPGQAPEQDQGPLRCPRCDSSNTKFCYYNNYSLSQPRHFCKSCKRYWTRGGTLRNVPVGGGCRKTKRVKRPSPSVVTSKVPASCASDGNAPAMFSSGNPHEPDLTYATLGVSSRIGGNGVGNFIRDFIMNLSSNSVVAGYGTSTSFVQTSSIDEIPPSMDSPLLALMIFQDQQKFINSGGLGLKEAGGIDNSFKHLCPSENVPAVDWSVPQPGQFDEIGVADLPMSCWNMFANGVNSSCHHNESGNNAGSSITSLI